MFFFFPNTGESCSLMMLDIKYLCGEMGMWPGMGVGLTGWKPERN